MTTELIFDEAGLKVALRYYLEAMRSKSENTLDQVPIHSRHITRIEVMPRIKKVKVIFEWGENDKPRSDTLR